MTLEVVEVRHQGGGGRGPGQPLPPGIFLHRTKDEILVADGGGVAPLARGDQLVFEGVLVADQQVTPRAEPAGKIEEQPMGGLNADEERHFPLARPVLAVRAAREAQRVGVEGEVIQGGEVTEWLNLVFSQ